MGRNKKGIQESQNVKGSMNSGVGRNFRTVVRNSLLLLSLLMLLLSLLLLLLSMLLLCNVEFDSNSSCLDRLNNLGINSFQKLQN